MAVATVVEILDLGDRVAFELDNESVLWGNGRKMRKAIAACGLRRGDLIDYQLDDTGALMDFRVVRDQT
jgi:hypothetical protein